MPSKIYLESLQQIKLSLCTPTEVRCSDPAANTEEKESDHIEADSRMILSKNTDVSRLVYFTEDTDFLLIAVAQDFAEKQVYMHQRHSTKNNRTVTDLYTDITELTSRLKNMDICLVALLLYYVLTGCDSVSYLYDQYNAHIPFIREESDRLIAKCFLLKDKKLPPIMSERPMLDEKTIKIVSCNCKTGCKNKMCPCRKVPIPCSILFHARRSRQK